MGWSTKVHIEEVYSSAWKMIQVRGQQPLARRVQASTSYCVALISALHLKDFSCLQCKYALLVALLLAERHCFSAICMDILFLA